MSDAFRKKVLTDPTTQDRAMADHLANQARTDHGSHDGWRESRDSGQTKPPKVRIKIETTNEMGETWSCDINLENPQRGHNDVVQELRSIVTKLLRIETIRNGDHVVLVDNGTRADTDRDRSLVGSTSSVTISRASPAKPILNPEARPFDPVTQPIKPAQIIQPSAAATNRDTKDETNRTGGSLAPNQTRSGPLKKADVAAMAVERWNAILASNPPLRDMLANRGHKVYDFDEFDEPCDDPGHGRVESQESNMEGIVGLTGQKGSQGEMDRKGKNKEIVFTQPDSETAAVPLTTGPALGSANIHFLTDSRPHEEGRSHGVPEPAGTPTTSNEGMELIRLDDAVAVDVPPKVQEQASNTTSVSPSVNPKLLDVVAVDPSSKVQEQASNSASVSPVNPKPLEDAVAVDALSKVPEQASNATSVPPSAKPKPPPQISQASRKVLDPLIWNQLQQFQSSVAAKKLEHCAAEQTEKTENTASISVGNSDARADERKMSTSQVSAGRQPLDTDGPPSHATTTEMRSPSPARPGEKDQSRGSARGSVGSAGSAPGHGKGERMAPQQVAQRQAPARSQSNAPPRGRTLTRRDNRPIKVDLPRSDIDTAAWRSASARSPPAKARAPPGFW